MKKYWLILLTMFAGNTYANPTYDATRGALQNDPSLCSYGYNPNCSTQGGYSGGYSSDDYSNAPSQPIPFYAAIAVNRNTGDWGWSTGTLQWHHLEAKMVVGLISYQIQGLVAQLKKKHYQTVEQAKLKTVKLKSTSLILSINTWLNPY